MFGEGGVATGAAAGLARDRHEHDRPDRPTRESASALAATRRRHARRAGVGRRGGRDRRRRSRSWSAAARRRSSAPSRCSRRWARTSSTSGRAAPDRSRRRATSSSSRRRSRRSREALVLAAAAGVTPAKVREALLGGFAASRSPRGPRPADARPGVRRRGSARGCTARTRASCWIPRRRSARRCRPSGRGRVSWTVGETGGGRARPQRAVHAARRGLNPRYDGVPPTARPTPPAPP